MKTTTEKIIREGRKVTKEVTTVERVVSRDDKGRTVIDEVRTTDRYSIERRG